MKARYLILIVMTSLGGSRLKAQDGLFFSAQPPIVVRFGSPDGKVYFTNTGEKILHGITLTSGKEQRTTRVIIDTIEPHKTVAIDGSIDLLLDGALTCTDYSKPLPIKS